MSDFTTQIIKSNILQAKQQEEINNVFIKCNTFNNFPLCDPNKILNKSAYITLLCDDVSNIVGYAFFNTYTDNQKNFLTDSDTLYNKNYTILNSIYIEQVALLPKLQNRQLGRKLYKEILKYAYTLPDLTAIYAHAAVDNKQSLKFHCKQGFIPIGDFRQNDFFGYKNYHSILY